MFVCVLDSVFVCVCVRPRFSFLDFFLCFYLLQFQIYLSRSLFLSLPWVDFIKVGRKAQIIEIALSKLGARRKARRTPLKSFSKVGRRAQKIL